jgi:TPR repeat protein
MEARTATGLMYRDGIGVDTSYPDALRLFQQGAIQGDYNAEVALSEIYELGAGVPQDSDKASFWKRKAYDNPVKVAQRQQAAQEAAASQLLFMGLSAVVEAMVRPDVYVVY